MLNVSAFRRRLQHALPLPGPLLIRPRIRKMTNHLKTGARQLFVLGSPTLITAMQGLCIGTQQVLIKALVHTHE
jgi:hypothetical protein